MVEGQTVAIIAIASLVGGMYVASMRAGNKMCANYTDFNTHITSFHAQCPKPNTLDIMKYFVL